LRVQVHNLMAEFDPLPGTDRTGYDILLAELDPAVSVLQLDMCWASISLQDIPALFKKYPARFELWHVKDVFGLKLASRSLTSNQRRLATMQVPVGMGDIDYKAIFALADLAGLKHFSMEQDNAASWGDSLAAARVGFENLTARVLA
jgi:sugar phosphate isomerase/epimerase